MSSTPENKGASPDPVTKVRPIGGDLVIPAMSLAFTIYYLATIWDFPWEAKLNGLMVGSVLIVLVVIFLLRTLRRVARGEANWGLGSLIYPRALLNRRLALVAISIAFIILIQWLGFTLSTLGFVFSTMFLLGVRSRFHLITIPLSVSLGGYLLFIVALNSRFPRGIFENLMTWMF